jgi:hypothetical protein
MELFVDEDFEMIAMKVKDTDTKFTLESVGIYRALNEGVRVIEKLATRTDSSGNSTKRIIIGDDLNLSYAN